MVYVIVASGLNFVDPLYCSVPSVAMYSRNPIQFNYSQIGPTLPRDSYEPRLLPPHLRITLLVYYILCTPYT